MGHVAGGRTAGRVVIAMSTFSTSRPEPGMPERRRGPRFPVRAGVQCRLDLRSRVRVIDISAKGVLIGTEISLPIGTLGHFRSGVGGGPISSAVDVRRVVTTAAPRPSVALGAIFTDMDDSSRRTLERFLERASAL